ncbi:hypothetical protein ES708_25181 [subsurface metagenome]
MTYVRGIRSSQPRIGARKMHSMLVSIFEENGIKMGRDKFFALLKENGLLVKPRRRKKITTDSNHVYRRYPNIIRKYVPSGPEQIWASDITYVSTEQGFVYVSLVTDQYSKKIMGYHVHPTLEAQGPLEALRMAMKNRCHDETNLIHHSDRGIQYCCEAYVNLLKRSNIHVSMSAPGNPYENAVAERVNGILKNEFYLDSHFTTIKQVSRTLRESVAVYNNNRPHASCDYLTPEQAHQQHGILKKRWKSYKVTPPKYIVPEDVKTALKQLTRKCLLNLV